MALRDIRKEGDPVLEKKCRPVERIDARLLTLLDDMADTMHAADGCGFAAPQVGVLKRAIVIDIGAGVIEFINPVITYQEGDDYGSEGCLSIPGVWGKVHRPEKIIVKALNREGKEFELEATGLLARAVCHECDHLDGILFRTKVEEYDD